MDTPPAKIVYVFAVGILSLALLIGIGVGAGETVVQFSPQSQNLSVGGSATYDIVVEDVDGGVSAYNIEVAIENATVAKIVSATDQTGAGLTDISIASNGSSASLRTALGNTTDTGSVTIAKIQINGTAEGRTDLMLSVQELADENATSYSVSKTRSADIIVGSPPDDTTTTSTKTTSTTSTTTTTTTTSTTTTSTTSTTTMTTTTSTTTTSTTTTTTDSGTTTTPTTGGTTLTTNPGVSTTTNGMPTTDQTTSTVNDNQAKRTSKTTTDESGMTTTTSGNTGGIPGFTTVPTLLAVTASIVLWLRRRDA